MAIIAPSSMGIDKAAAVIHKTLAEINSEAMYGLHGRSQNIETQVVSSGKNIDQLKAEAISLKAEATSSSERLKRMEATNDILRQYLQGRRGNSLKHIKGVSSVRIRPTFLQKYII